MPDSGCLEEAGFRKVNIYSVIASLGRLYGRIPAHTPLLGDRALPPLFLVLEVTYRCNLECPFCYVHPAEANKSSANRKKELSVAEIESILDDTPPWSLVLLSGGEILVRSDFSEVVRSVVKKRRCHIFTNGTLITPARAAEWVDLGVSSIAVSVEGPEDIHDSLRGAGTFARTLAGIKSLVDCRALRRKRLPLINLKTTITSANLDTLSDSVRIAEASGADYCTFQALNTTDKLGGRALQTALDYASPPPSVCDCSPITLDQQLRKIRELSRGSRIGIRFLPSLPMASILAYYANNLRLSDYTCVSPWTVAYVSPYGDVYPCLNYLVGNVRELSLRQLWNGPRYRLFRREIRRRGLFSDCRGCCDLLRA